MSDQEPDKQANEGLEHQQENISSTENERENEGQELQQENIYRTENEGENVHSVGQQESTNSGIENEGQELQQENTSSTKNEGENVDGVGHKESIPNSGMNTDKEGQELQQENKSSTKNEGENVDGVGHKESIPNSGIDTKKEGQELQQENNTSSTKNEGENVVGVGLQESTNSGIDTKKMLEGLTNAIACENKRHSQKMLEGLTNVIARENNIHSQKMTTLVTKELARTIQTPDMVTTALKELVITQQNPDADTVVQQESRPYEKIEDADTVVQQESRPYAKIEDEAGKAFYDTSGKRGLLFILQLEDSQDWKTSNGNDLKVLTEFFEVTLGFEVWSYNTFSDLEAKLNQMSLPANNYYCLMICISGHGNESGVITKWAINEETKERVVLNWKTIGEIQKRFSNVTIKSLSGVPKIIFIDTCRGSVDNTTTFPEKNRKKVVPLGPTTDSDSITIHATTHGFMANIPDEGSFGIQGVMEIFQKDWKKDHLEEMLIDARINVASWGEHFERQILEIQTTLLNRLMFEKFIV